jgi:hypothetical protein
LLIPRKTTEETEYTEIHYIVIGVVGIVDTRLCGYVAALLQYSTTPGRKYFFILHSALGKNILHSSLLIGEKTDYWLPITDYVGNGRVWTTWTALTTWTDSGRLLAGNARCRRHQGLLRRYTSPPLRFSPSSFLEGIFFTLIAEVIDKPFMRVLY